MPRPDDDDLVPLHLGMELFTNTEAFEDQREHFVLRPRARDVVERRPRLVQIREDELLGRSVRERGPGARQRSCAFSSNATCR
jgi:hypothetical protein